MNEQTQVPKVI